MCVAVTMAPGSTLTEEEIVKMGNANGDGFGIAWAEDGVVHWYKTLQYDAGFLTSLVNHYKNFQRLVHFRLTTVGGVQLGLCHPFEIGPRAAYQQRGHANKVLIHNGHWYRAGDIHDILKKEGALPDNGPWSDTRLAAFLASHDEDWLTTVTGKVATLDGEGNLKLYANSGEWSDLREGIKVSNKAWDHNYDYKRSGLGRRWEGWGWSDKNWQQKEAHEKAKAEEAKEEEKSSGKEKQQEKSAGTSSKGGKGAGSTVGVGTKDGQVHGQDTQGTSGGRRYTGPGDTGGQKPLPQGQGKEGPNGQEGVRIHDYTPWYQESTGRWFQVDPTAVNTGKPVVREVSESYVREFMEQVAAASGQTRD